MYAGPPFLLLRRFTLHFSLLTSHRRLRPLLLLMFLLTFAALASAQECAGHLEEAWQLHRQIYDNHAAHNASYKNRLDDLREMTRIRLRQGRPEEALEHARDAWRQTLAEPSSQLEPDYLEYIAEFALNTWKAVQAAKPGVAVPEELEAWRIAAGK